MLHKSNRERGVALDELQRASEAVLCVIGAHDDGFCTFNCVVSTKTHVGRQLSSPATRSLRACLGYLQRLTAASHIG